MACLKHNVAMLRLALGGDVRGPRHARLLADSRRCRWCRQPAPPSYRFVPEPPPVPAPRVRTELRLPHYSQR